MTQHQIIQIITAAPASVAFSLLFNIRGKRKLTAIAIGGCLAWLLHILLVISGLDEAMSYFIVSTLVSLFAEAMARILKAPTTLFIAPCAVPLIPGASLYYTMAYAFSGNHELFAKQAISTLRLAAAIAVGIVVAAFIMKVAVKHLPIKSAHQEQNGAPNE